MLPNQQQQLMRRVFGASLVSLSFLSVTPALAVVDCKLDCTKNCLIAAPGSKEYCNESCNEYCADTERQDGLSGSKDATKGETGIFGGSIDPTTTRDLPPKLPFALIPEDLSRAYGISKSRMQAPR